MTDAEYRKQKQRISKLADKWFAPLGLSWWSIDLRYHREGIPTSKENQAGNWECRAQAEVKWEYLSAALNFNLPAVAESIDEELERTFVHECCHVLINEMRMWAPAEISQDKMEEAMKHEERVVSAMTNAFLWTRKDGERKLKRGKQ